ncbi:serine hydrolase [Muricauda sp. JGD-17]|uniref:Serine hydrolase n=1 Tax=Flagellimonas ochracea TaxID=2696472 RepID=A0A964WX07_9FLAO|nr:serine hydrolase [Allomuricauda ochracea]NAY91104.1 serine hydrolase [Allomuricauda ochracea]
MRTKRTFPFLLITIIFIVSSCKEVKKEKSIETAASEKVIPTDDFIFSTLISKNGEIVFQEYYNGKTIDSLCDVQSLTKGLMSILIGIAIDKEYIKDVDEPIVKYFPNEFKNLTDTKKNTITIKHLLNQTSGLSWKGYLEHEEWLNNEDPISFVLKKDLENNPGEKYNYNSGATHLLSVIISRVSGKSTLEFANEFLFDDLNIYSTNWQKRNKGYYDGSGLGLKMKPIDLMKIGQLLEKNGDWNGLQLVSKEWIQKMFDENEKSSTEWGLKNSKHGFCWYQSEFKRNKIDYGMGYGGQFIIMIPDKELIIVTTHNHDTPNGIEQQMKFLNTKLPKLIEKYGS